MIFFRAFFPPIRLSGLTSDLVMTRFYFIRPFELDIYAPPLMMTVDDRKLDLK